MAGTAYRWKAAIRYLTCKCKELNLDPDRFAVWGNSAGGTVTQLLAVTGDEEDMDDLNVGVKASSKNKLRNRMVHNK